MKCKVTSQTFLVTFVYGFNTIVSIRDMWNMLRNYGLARTKSWMVLGDFNSILISEKKRNGEPITLYQFKDFTNCCLATRLVDVNSSGFFYT